MAFKRFTLNERTIITVYKRQTSRSLRLSVTAAGEVRVTIPSWAPYSAGIDFARAREQWIHGQKQPQVLLEEGCLIGKAHHLRFQPSPNVKKPTSRLRNGEAMVIYPVDTTPHETAVQQAARAVSIRALRSQAEALLPRRLEDLARKYNFTYRSVSIKHLKSRWGSCDAQGNIVLNLFLMQVPWDCIDYVILHELTHTKVLRHGPPFWTSMEQVMPAARQLRKTMHTYHPVL
jgi:predicted metal-dependent hydrolase